MEPNDSDIVHDAAQKFWKGFKTLVNESIHQIDPNLRSELMMQMQDMASVYGVYDPDYKRKKPKK